MDKYVMSEDSVVMPPQNSGCNCPAGILPARVLHISTNQKDVVVWLEKVACPLGGASQVPSIPH